MDVRHTIANVRNWPPSEDVAMIYDRRARAVDMVAQHSQLIVRQCIIYLSLSWAPRQ
jgi:hypothetical protein